MSEKASTDRIEKHVMLRTTQSRVWKALADSTEFGVWFRARFEGGFAAGKTTRGNITYPGYEHLKMELFIESMEPERYFAFRWHPYAIDPDVDYSHEPTTLVEFVLKPIEGGVELTISESGFDKIPAERRHEAFIRNGEGWAAQAENIKRYVSE